MGGEKRQYRLIGIELSSIAPWWSKRRQNALVSRLEVTVCMFRKTAVTIAFVAQIASMGAPSHAAQADSVRLRWQHATPGVLPQAMVTAEAGVPVLFVAQKSGGISVLETHRRTGARQIAVVGKHRLGHLDAMNLVRRGNYLYVALGDFFAPTEYAGLAIIDIRDSRRPGVTDVWKSTEKLRGAAAIAVGGGRAYLGAMSEGILVLDVRDPRKIRFLRGFQPNIHYPRPRPNRIQRPNARGMALSGDQLFVAYDAGGLRVIDIRDAMNPREVGRYVNSKMMGKQQAYNNLVLDGNRAFIAVDYAGLEIVDISNPSKMRQLAWWNPWKAETTSNFWLNSPGHTNQLHYDKRNRMVYLSAGASELQVVDVSSIRRPRLHTTFGSPQRREGVWGLTFANEIVYLAYIRTVIPFQGTWAGVRAVSAVRRNLDLRQH